MARNRTPVVIARKSKRLFRSGHAVAFVLTSGASAVVTAAKAATNAGYNAQTRKLDEDARIPDAPVPGIRSRPDACPECQYIDGFHYLTCSQYQDSEVGRAEQREAYLASREQACRDQIAAGRDVKYWTRKLAEVRSEEQP